MTRLQQAASDLARAVSGVNWNANAVEASIKAIHKAGKRAEADDQAAALQVLVERIGKFRVEDCDGTAHAVLTAGSLVEWGAPAPLLAEVLLEKVPAVLEAARACADACLADPRTPAADEDEDDENEEEDDDEEDDEEYDEDYCENLPDVLTEVDGRPILLQVFRDHLKKQPSYGALAYLNEWTLASVAAWTRSREHLIRATKDRKLVKQAGHVAQSDAHWLRTLLGVQLDATWLVLCPLESRGFRVFVDGVVSNQDLHVQLAAALVPRGIAGQACAKKVITYLEGRTDDRPASWVDGTWNLYDYRAIDFDLRDGSKVPDKYWVWAEGIPTDVPQCGGPPTLIVGPESIIRSWTLERMFTALPSQVTVTEELDGASFKAEMARVRAATKKGPKKGPKRT